jgi:hypothetical protein
LTNVVIRDSYGDFTFIIGNHRYRCSLSLAQFLSPRVAKLHSVDDTVDEIRIGVEDPDELVGVVLEAARGDSITIDSAHRLMFLAICAVLWNSELYESIYGQLGSEVMMENVIDRLRFLWATRCDISTEFEFIASHFYGFLCRPDALKALPFSMIFEIIGQGSLSVDSEDNPCDFISKGIETTRDSFSLLEFVRLEYCSTNTERFFRPTFPVFFQN